MKFYIHNEKMREKKSQSIWLKEEGEEIKYK